MEKSEYIKLCFKCNVSHQHGKEKRSERKNCNETQCAISNKLFNEDDGVGNYDDDDEDDDDDDVITIDMNNDTCVNRGNRCSDIKKHNWDYFF